MNIELTSVALASVRHAASDTEATMSAQAFASAATRDAIVAEIEALDADGRALRALEARRKLIAPLLADALAAMLGEGEVEIAPSGRIAYLGRVSGGRKAINETAIVERASELPDDLRPVKVWRFPNVGDVEKAAKAKRIPRELAAAIITKPERVTGLRWRTLDGDDNTED